MDETLGLVAGAIVTLLIFSYLLKDSVLYRWALALLVGSATGYVLGTAVDFVLRRWIRPALQSPDSTTQVGYIVPLLLGALLLLKGFPPRRLMGRIATIGNLSLGFLVGVGAAVAVSGALTGTLIPQVLATGAAVTFENGIMGLIQGLVLALGTSVTLLVFTVRRPAQADASIWGRFWRTLGHFFLAVALGVAFAGAITSGLTALVQRVMQIIELITKVTGNT